MMKYLIITALIVLSTLPPVFVCHRYGNGTRQTIVTQSRQSARWHMSHGDVAGVCKR